MKNVLDKIADIINSECVNLHSDEFYSKILDEIYTELKFSVSAVYFLDNFSFEQKTFSLKLKNNLFKFSFQNEEEFLNFLNKRSEKTFLLSEAELKRFFKPSFYSSYKDKFFIVSKLSIKSSIFGFIILMTDKKPVKIDISTVNLFASAYSYLIKEYELNKVFKAQLNILQDAIIEKEKAQKTIQKQNKKLIEADKAKTTFLANVSHELRTPLNAIIGFSDVLKNKVFGEMSEKQTEYILDINSNAVHLLGVLNSILDFSKIECGAMKLNLSEFDPALAVNDVINLLSSLSEAKEIKILYDNKFEGKIHSDYQKFQQILFNLIGNAVKFSKEKSKIIVRTEQKGEKFVLEVEDFGIGIEKKYQNFIFKKFTQIDNVYTKKGTSTGLGLAITKEYVNLLKGKIYVLSVLGKGSTFVVELINTLN